MSEVVNLDRASRRRSRGGRPRPSKTALVLGGGGLTGGVYEIGALRALDLLAVNSTVNDFDIYVGTSAGAFIASMTANGITPEEMMRVLNRQRPSPIKELTLSSVLRPNIKGFAGAAAVTPLRIAGVLRQIAGNIGDSSLMDIAVRLSDALPTGLYTGAGIESYVREALSDPDRTNDFRLMDRELYLTGTAIDTADRVVFGQGEWADVPISKAVEASGALPIAFEPVSVKGVDMIDGGIRSTTNVDIAVEAGAKFIVVVNPLVPYINDFETTIPTLTGSRPKKVADGGMAGIANQVFRMISHDRLHRAVEEWENRYPGVDIILIEPEPDDELMFSTSIMDFSARLEIAKHGFESVTLRLARDFDQFAALAERHGLEISERRVRHVIDQVERQRDSQPAWRRVFEQTTSVLLGGFKGDGGDDDDPPAVADADVAAS